MRRFFLATLLVLFSASLLHADSMYTGTAMVTQVSSTEEVIDWTFTLAGGDPFNVVHDFTDYTVFSYGGFQIVSETTTITGDLPPAGWIPEFENFTNTPNPSPLTWDVTLFNGTSGDQCDFCANWSPVVVPEPNTLFLLALGLLGAGWSVRRTKAE